MSGTCCTGQDCQAAWGPWCWQTGARRTHAPVNSFVEGSTDCQKAVFWKSVCRCCMALGALTNCCALTHHAAESCEQGVSVVAVCVCGRFSSNATAEDTDVQFRVWAIKSAVKRLPLYVQVSTHTMRL